MKLDAVFVAMASTIDQKKRMVNTREIATRHLRDRSNRSFLPGSFLENLDGIDFAGFYCFAAIGTDDASMSTIVAVVVVVKYSIYRDGIPEHYLSSLLLGKVCVHILV